MQRFLRYFALLAFLSVSAFVLVAQFATGTRLVVLHASVSDRHGNLVPTLDRSAFHVFENGVSQQMRVFRHEDVPVSLGIVIDGSGSMQQKLPRVGAAAVALVRASNQQDEVFIVNFNDQAFLDVPFTNDVHKMEEGIARIDARGGTAMRDAIGMSLDYAKGNAKKEKRVLLVITDGNDNASRSSLDRITRQAAQTEVVVYAIGLFSQEKRSEAAEARQALTRLTSETGGLVFYPKDVSEVQRLAVEIAQDIRSQYIIAYSPEVQSFDGTYRQIKLTVSGPGGPIVRTRRGYFATPEETSVTGQDGAGSRMSVTSKEAGK
jgi:Ca-activated chloride channel family protein